jgi:hypothetical protein
VKTAGYIECSLRRRPGWPGIIVNAKETFIQMQESSEALENDLQKEQHENTKKKKKFQKVMKEDRLSHHHEPCASLLHTRSITTRP